MKITGIILIVLGAISTLGGILGTISGQRLNLAGLTFVILGAYLVHRANQKKEEKEEAEKKKQWIQGNIDDK